MDEVKTVVNIVNHNNLTGLLKEIQENLLVNECFAPERCDAIKNTIFLILTISYYLPIKRYRKNI